MSLDRAGRVLPRAMELRTSTPVMVKSASPTETESVNRIIRYRLHPREAETGNRLRGTAGAARFIRNLCVDLCELRREIRSVHRPAGQGLLHGEEYCLPVIPRLAKAFPRPVNKAAGRGTSPNYSSPTVSTSGPANRSLHAALCPTPSNAHGHPIAFPFHHASGA